MPQQATVVRVEIDQHAMTNVDGVLAAVLGEILIMLRFPQRLALLTVHKMKYITD
jgi:hypothetical protein